MRKISHALFPLFLCLYASSAFAALFSWDTTGVSDTSKVTGIIQLTNNSVDNTLGGGASFNVSPWSKNGKWIVYRDSSSIGGNICKINAASGISNCMTNGFLNASEYVFNPSFGTDYKIYFEKRVASDYEIWRMNSDGTNKENLTAAHSGTSERYVKVSPDAQWIAFFSNNALWVAQSDGTMAHNVSGLFLVDSPQHSWSPDSQWLVYQGVEGGQRWIYKVRMDGTENQSLTKPNAMINPQIHLWPSWSPDGEKIAYLWSGDSLFEHADYIKIITKDGQLLQTMLDSAARPLADTTIGIYGPFSWSPDSQWITYIKKGGGDNAIFITNVENPVEKAQLTNNYDDNKPIWSPAGDRTLFVDAGIP